MASTFLPFRAGELVRAVFLGNRESVAVPRVVGTIVLEKLFDFLAIGVMLVVLVLLVPLPAAATAAGLLIGAAIFGGFGFVVALAVWRTPTLAFVVGVERALPFAIGPKLRLEHVARQFAQGTDSLRVPRLWVLLLGWTAATWVCSLASGWFGAQSLGVSLSLPALLFLIVLTSSGQAVPSSPGYVGVYHAAATLALVQFGIDPTLALGIALITHAFSYGTLVVAGLVALWTGGYTFGDLVSSISKRAPSGTPAAPAPAIAADT
jgi:glycosyltransferase 2 family protein